MIFRFYSPSETVLIWCGSVNWIKWKIIFSSRQWFIFSEVAHLIFLLRSFALMRKQKRLITDNNPSSFLIEMKLGIIEQLSCLIDATICLRWVRASWNWRWLSWKESSNSSLEIHLFSFELRERRSQNYCANGKYFFQAPKLIESSRKKRENCLKYSTHRAGCVFSTR